jgi:tRNA(Ser,Leu) C12 N-acetylase TAN1
VQQWNVVVNVRERGYRRAFNVLSEFGAVRRTAFFNVLVMEVDDVQGMLEAIRQRTLYNPNSLSFLSRLIPVTEAFTFQPSEEFEIKARETVLKWVPKLGGKSFHVRMHRRGLKGKLSSYDEEHFLDDTLLEALEKAGTPGSITFDDPDAVLAVETLDHRAGLGLFRREELQRYPFMRPE